MATIHVRSETELAKLGIRVDPGDPTRAVPIRPARAGQAGPIESATARRPPALETQPAAAGGADARDAGRQPQGEEGDIEKALRDLFPPLERHQGEALRRMIEAGEVAPRVVVWKGTGVVVDGREARRICDELRKPYETEVRDFADLDAVVRWRIEGQLLHRNLTPVAASYYRGKLYLGLKRQGRRPDHIFRQTGEIRTDRLVGRRFGVGARTISRDADLCIALDTLAEPDPGEALDELFPGGFALGCEYRSAVLSGRIRPTRGEVLCLGRMRQDEMARAIREMLDGQQPCPKRAPTIPVPDTPEPDPPPVVPPGPIPGEGTVPGPDQPAPREPGGKDQDAIDGHGLDKINRVWGKLNEATQLAFLRQDEVTKRISQVGFVLPVLPGVEGGAA